jgi:Na+:H+ antiporter, NhaA family
MKLLRPITRQPVQYLLGAFVRFVQLESSDSIFLLLAATAALALANSRFASAYESLLTFPLHAAIATASMSWTLRDFVNDGLMTGFFLVMGLEVKRELLVGELTSPRRALLPILAALGGILIPIGLYLTLNHCKAAEIGWGVPIATDVAFSLAVLAFFGSTVPMGLKVFLVTLAIVDDIAGVLVIAVVYTEQLDTRYLILTFSIVLFCLVLNWIGVEHLGVYIGVGAALWLAVHASGLHATLTGILLALMIPASRAPKNFLPKKTAPLASSARSVPGDRSVNLEVRKHAHAADSDIDRVESPLDRLQSTMHPWVSFGVVPLFALANADISLHGVPLNAGLRPIFLGVLVGLFLGKPIGITVFSWLAVHFRVAELPRGVTMAQLHAVSWLGGIGFTVSIFIAGLAFPEREQYAVSRVAVLLASIFAAISGGFLLTCCFNFRRKSVR